MWLIFYVIEPLKSGSIQMTMTIINLICLNSKFHIDITVAIRRFDINKGCQKFLDSLKSALIMRYFFILLVFQNYTFHQILNLYRCNQLSQDQSHELLNSHKQNV